METLWPIHFTILWLKNWKGIHLKINIKYFFLLLLQDIGWCHNVFALQSLIVNAGLPLIFEYVCHSSLRQKEYLYSN